MTEVTRENSRARAQERRPRHACRLTLPMLINGRRFSADGNLQALPGSRAEVVTPAFTAAAKDQILALNRQLLVDLPLHEIASFLNRVGRNWRSEDYSRRRIFIRQLQTVLGYSQPAAEHEADWIGALLTSHARMFDVVEIDLGHRFILDEWVRVEEAFVRAYPLGLVAHILPGNVPSSCVLSAVRALLTKNISVLKVSSADPVTPTSFVLSLMEVDPAHPVAQAMSAVYWPEDDPLGEEVVHSADAVCAWGTAAAIQWARDHAGPEARFVQFGPKRSMALVGRGADVRRAALGLAHDVSAYDQAACFSVQRVFIEGDAGEFLNALEEALRHYEELLPPQQLSVDEFAYLNSRRLDFVFSGGQEWAVTNRAAVIVTPPDIALEQPLNRTLLVHPVDDLRQAYDFVDSGVQTVAAAPWELLTVHRDALARRGVSRFVDLGLANFFRVGGTHDGIRPLQHLVRFVSHETSAREIPKGMVLRLDFTQILENKSFQDVIF